MRPVHRVIASVLVAIVLAGCASSTPLATTEAPVDEDCGALAVAGCLDSSACTLVQEEEGGPYTCRDAEGECELGFRQGSDGEAECRERDGCTFSSGRCFCPPGVTCICGGGPPPQCHAPGEAPDRALE